VVCKGYPHRDSVSRACGKCNKGVRCTHYSRQKPDAFLCIVVDISYVHILSFFCKNDIVVVLLLLPLLQLPGSKRAKLYSV